MGKIMTGCLQGFRLTAVYCTRHEYIYNFFVYIYRIYRVHILGTDKRVILSPNTFWNLKNGWNRRKKWNKGKKGASLSVWHKEMMCLPLQLNEGVNVSMRTNEWKEGGIGEDRGHRKRNENAEEEGRPREVSGNWLMPESEKTKRQRRRHRDGNVCVLEWKNGMDTRTIVIRTIIS